MTPRRAPARRRASRLPFAAVLLFAAALFLGRDARAAGEPPIPEPTGYVNDHAGLMDETARAKLEAFLDQVEKKTGAQFAVLTVKSTAPLTASEYKVRVFDQWKIGKQGEDLGLLLLVATEERDARFETGYGLEGTLPDGFQSRLFRREMAPRFREGDYAGGITAGMIGCAARLAAEKGVTLEWNGEALRYRRGGDFGLPARGLILFVVFVILLLMIASGLAGRSLGGGRGGRRGGGYRGGGYGGGFGGGFFGGLGGFGGSGGGSWLGGFGGGSSFGGFGGGSSGGGGGGGHW